MMWFIVSQNVLWVKPCTLHQISISYSTDSSATAWHFYIILLHLKATLSQNKIHFKHMLCYTIRHLGQSINWATNASNCECQFVPSVLLNPSHRPRENCQQPVTRPRGYISPAHNIGYSGSFLHCLMKMNWLWAATIRSKINQLIAGCFSQQAFISCIQNWVVRTELSFVITCQRSRHEEICKALFSEYYFKEAAVWWFKFNYLTRTHKQQLTVTANSQVKETHHPVDQRSLTHLL